MDWNDIKSQVSNLTLYDVKAGFRKAQNAVMNYTEMESKVREATNNEPWGASSTLMQEIANGTFNYQTLNEIMPMIYRRFTEKAAEEWRQIYKALQLLEFLIKHGSERVIDDARSHLTLLKMLRQFHFIDQNGKDQGINVRNRAKELSELLGDVDRIRAERKKARANKAKYTGVEGGASLGFSSSSSSGRYGGFGSESAYGGGGSSTNFGGYSGGVYGDGGGFGGQASDFRDTQRRGEQFEEYDEYDEGEAPASSSAAKPKRSSTERMGVKKTTEPPKKKEPEVDLFSFDDPAPATASATTAAGPPASSNGSGLASLSADNADDDEFDDFQSAPSAPAGGAPSLSGPPMVTSTSTGAQFAAPQPVSAPQRADLSSMMSLSSMSPAPSVASTATPGGGAANYSAFSAPPAPTLTSHPVPKPSGYQAAAPNYFQSVQVGTQQTISSPAASTPMSGLGKPAASKPAAAAGGGGGGGDAFAGLWTAASANTSIKKTQSPMGGPAMGQLAKEKSAAGIWGAPANSTPKPAGGGPGAGPGAGASSSGLDDLLG